MKSGPTLNGATRCPARRSAPIKPVATVVFPLPDAGAAMTTAGTLTSPLPASWERSPLDALLTLAADVHRMLDLGHLRHQIGGVEQCLRRVAAGDHDVLGSGPGGQGRDYLVDVDPSPLQRISELVEHIEVMPLLGDPAR